MKGQTARPSVGVQLGLILVLGACLTCGTLAAISVAEQDGYLSRWQTLGSPAGSPSRILAADYLIVDVETEDGSVFSHKNEWGDFGWSSDQAVWNPVVSPQAEPEQSCEYRPARVPPPPQPYSQLIAFSYCPEPRFFVQYALGGDGQVWRWATPDAMGIFLTGVLPTLGISFLLSTLMIRALARTYPPSEP